MTRKSTGFTIVELLIVMIIIAILAAIALPSYQTSVIKTRREEGRTALMKVMQQQERYYSLHTSYLAFSSASTADNEKRFLWYSGDTAANSHYEVSGQPCKGEDIRDCIQLVARPGTDKVNGKFSDPVCGELMLTSRGQKKALSNVCWP